jgi:hypothetical protein
VGKLPNKPKQRMIKMRKIKELKYKKEYMDERTYQLLKEINNRLHESGDFIGQYSLYNCGASFNVRRFKTNWKDYRGIRRWLSFEHLFSIMIGNRDGELFIFVLDRREHQPYYESKYCTQEGMYGHYEFPNIEEFMNHLSPEYGIDTKFTAYEYTDYEGGPTHIWIPDYICL